MSETSEPIKAASEAAKFCVTIAGDEDEGKGGLEALKDVEGWRRSSLHKVYDSLWIGVGKEAKQNVAPKFVVVHGEFSPRFEADLFFFQGNLRLTLDGTGVTEFDSESYVDTEEYQAAIKGKSEVRRWKLYKATTNTAPKA